MTLGEFYDALAKHDWTYDYSDDHEVWARGRDESRKLFEAAQTSPAHAELHAEWLRWFRRGIREGVWEPRPTRPNVEET